MEGDKFERRLKGFGWKKAYRLAKIGVSVPHVVDALTPAVSHALRNELKCTQLGKILSILQFSLQTNWQHQSDKDFLNQPSPYACLCVELERIESNEPGSITARLASEAAQSVYTDLQSLKDSRSEQQVKNCFAEELNRRIIDNRFLSHVREGVVLNNEYSVTEYEQWEKDVSQAMGPQAHLLFNNLIRDDGSQRIARAPRRLVPKKKLTKESLHQPLQELVR